MKRRVLGFLLVTALLAAVASFATACGGGGGDELTLDEYFQQLQAIGDDLEEQGNALEAEIEGAFTAETSAEEAIAALEAFLTEGVEVFQEALAEIEDMNPPSEAKDAHDRFVESARTRVDLIENLAESVGEAETLEDLQQVITDLADVQLEEETRLQEACHSLEQIASDKGLQLDLNCD